MEEKFTGTQKYNSQRCKYLRSCGQLSKRSLVLKGRKSTRSLVQQVSCPKVRCTEVTWQKVNTEKVSCLSTFPITWKNQILTPSYSVFYMPLSISFPGKKSAKMRHFPITYMEKPNRDSFLLCILYASFISRKKNRPKRDTFQLHGKTKS